MNLSWLHISDFHFKADDPYDRDTVLRSLVQAIRDFRRVGRNPDLIFATGDIAHSGKASEYAIASAFFDSLLDAAKLTKKRLFVIPGNHDVARDAGEPLKRTLGSREEADKYFRAGTPKPHLTHKLLAFVQWHNSYFGGIRSWPEDSTCGPVEKVRVGRTSIGILPINTALFCQDDQDHDKLWIGRRCLDESLKSLRTIDADLNVALIHHPIEWLSQIEASNIAANLQEAVDFVLRGHLHHSNVEKIVGMTGSTVYAAAGAAYQTRQWPNCALYMTVLEDHFTIFPIRYEDSPREVWTVDTSLFPHAPNYEGRYVRTNSLPSISPPLNQKTTSVLFSSPSREDLKNIGITTESVEKYLFDEATRHPEIFVAAFTSLPFAMQGYLVIASLSRYDRKQIYINVERVLSRTEAYPATGAWVNALSHYRRASALSYRRKNAPPIQATVKQILKQYRQLIKALVSYFEKREEAYGSGYDTQLLADMLEEAVLYADTANEREFIMAVEMILSHAHKLLLDFAPSIRSASVLSQPTPPTPQPAPEHRTSGTQRRSSKLHKRIMIAEDEGMIRKMMVDILRNEFPDIEILEAGSGVEALQKMVDQSFDLLITDILMVQMDGVELARTMRKASPETKIVIVSAYRNAGGFEEAVKLSDLFIGKPFHPEWLISAVRGALRKGAKRPSRRTR